MTAATGAAHSVIDAFERQVAAQPDAFAVTQALAAGH